METERMKKYILLFLVALLANIILSQTLAADTFQGYEKVIWIDQLKQVGTAYESSEKLKKVREFPVLTGDDETTTDPGMYVNTIIRGNTRPPCLTPYFSIIQREPPFTKGKYRRRRRE
jgi:hypothetical protein